MPGKGLAGPGPEQAWCAVACGRNENYYLGEHWTLTTTPGGGTGNCSLPQAQVPPVGSGVTLTCVEICPFSPQCGPGRDGTEGT